MNATRFSLVASVVAGLTLNLGYSQITSQTATTDPVGFVTVGITAGTGSAKKNTLFSLPLLETEAIDGQVAGTITGVTANTISNSNAGWTAGALSDPTMPFLIQITSGAAEGRMFLISSSAATGGAVAGAANTATEVTISSLDAAQIDLTTLGVVEGTDTYKIFACDTISSFFGTPEATGIQGGASAANADTIIAVVNGSSSTYFYSTANGRWSRVALGSPDASNVPLLPYYGIQYGRIASTPLSFVVTGGVPTSERQVSVKNSGSTLLAQYWPADSTLGSLGIENLAGWQSGSTAASADTVVLTSAGSANTYFYNGTNWKRVALGSPDADNTVIPVGTTVSIVKKGSAGGYSTLTQQAPYSL
jgi:hypothetical protein